MYVRVFKPAAAFVTTAGSIGRLGPSLGSKMDGANTSALL